MSRLTTRVHRLGASGAAGSRSRLHVRPVRPSVSPGRPAQDEWSFLTSGVDARTSPALPRRGGSNVLTSFPPLPFSSPLAADRLLDG